MTVATSRSPVCVSGIVVIDYGVLNEGREMDKLETIIKNPGEKIRLKDSEVGEILGYLNKLVEAQDPALDVIQTKVYTLEDAKKVQKLIDFLIQE